MAQDSPFETGSAPTPETIELRLDTDATAALNTKTALVKQPKDGTERLKPYRWQKGRSGNPGGRPRKLPISERLHAMLEMPLPDSIRIQLENAIKAKLPKNLTIGDGYALDMCLAMFGKDPGFRLDVAREIREAVEGKSSQRIFIPDPPPQETVDDITKKLWAWAAETEYKRCMLFNMPVPQDTINAAKKLGVPLELPPCQQEGQQQHEQPREPEQK